MKFKLKVGHTGSPKSGIYHCDFQHKSELITIGPNRGQTLRVLKLCRECRPAGAMPPHPQIAYFDFIIPITILKYTVNT